ncbi:MAG: hypothetical protein JSV44_07045 [Candidatus Zixiibacteriota bacterium]|nr:MAG: hypothetical protein JSV44_07045 [candidate division Zixibacteria bacterium]
MIRFLIAALLVFFTPGLLSADVRGNDYNGVEFELIIRQKPALLDKYFEVMRSTVEAVVGKRLSTFQVNFSLELNVSVIDSPFAVFDCHLATIGQKPYTIARRNRIEFNLPARIENIPGKNRSVYQLLISPRRPITIDTIACPYDPMVPEQFKTEPSANFDLFFVEGSLADHKLSLVKNYLEAEYVRFRNALDLNIPGKVNFYLCPCPVTAVRWDSRFGYAIEPGRSSIYALYGHHFISSDAILTNMLKLLRQWGYAPPFIVEGLAGYFEFSQYEMNKIINDDRLPEIKKILTTAGYYAADPQAAELSAASFVKYLADTYGINKVRQWYEEADDLSILRSLEAIFKRPLDSLESGWRYYVDTTSLSRTMFDFYAARSGALFRWNEQLEYLNKMREYDENRFDSVDTWKKLSMTYYQSGDYYKAADGYRLLLEIDSVQPIYWQILGNLHMANGEYDSAWQAFDRVCEVNSTYVSARLLQAKILSIKGDTAGAISLAEEYHGTEKTLQEKIAFQLLLGQLKAAAGTYHDSAAAEAYFSDALYWSNEVLSQSQDDPATTLRAGLAAFGLKDYQEAGKYLELAQFIETRAIFLGEILLALGKLHDVLGNRELAIEYYREGLNRQIAAYHRDLCLKYINQPYND